MTKLEEKLIQLGYEKIIKHFYYEKTMDGWRLSIELLEDKISHTCVFNFPVNRVFIETQQDIDNLQQAFNQLQKDLEVLKSD